MSGSEKISELEYEKSSQLIDALPYIDEITPEQKQTVDALLRQEFRAAHKQPKDYLKEFAPLPAPRWDKTSMLQTEYNRVKKGLPLPPMNTQRYSLAPPSTSQQHEVTAWKDALDNAYAQLEHQHTRILNLDLFLKYGADIWRSGNELTIAILESVTREAHIIKEEIDMINKKRKISQEMAGRELMRLHDKWRVAVAKNIEIAEACNIVEGDIKELEDLLKGDD